MRSIGQAAALTGLKQTTIRYYEEEGLIRPPQRTESGRRRYGEEDIKRLGFIRHARALGFELADIRSLIALSDRPDQSCIEANHIAQRHLDTIEQRLAQLSALKRELTLIARCCCGGVAAECRVIEALSDHGDCQAIHGA
ncbi:MAG: helix-turn-helix domain-containing protein [Hyphomonadaceae bacterium]|nr:helix-turn-helix domain-containing protein [Hyphomonadaceae bacterium]